jgi:hypothetical protein
MQTGELVVSGLALFLLTLLCVRLAQRRPDPQQQMSIEDLEKKVEQQKKSDIEHSGTR